MKVSTSMVAFLVSTAIHVGALSSNLLHVNAESVSKNNTRTVRLHIVAPAIPAQPTPLPEAVHEITENPRPVLSEIPNNDLLEQSEDVRHDLPVSVESVPVPDNVPHPLQVLEIEKYTYETVPTSFESPEERAGDNHPVLPGASESEPCRACRPFFSLLAHASVAAKRSEGPGIGGGKGENPAAINFLSKPDYPRYSRLHNEEGTTVLSVEILPDGKLGKVEVVQSSGFLRLDQAALKGIRKADLVPAVKEGKRIASIKRIAIKFDLEDWGE